ncbi:kinase-like domain-containing protein [Kickxella alabastrina]|uniref:kinase-like domain-containing protein n=1 Tax=Kickxella alabastrina TaxID=61397 RepID=UPI00221F5159|nr:kinase-like domain-containing protein [Kickxella alabastrina]KAI7830974.1 kinase-like domain-containing protein [Kickxella alabastrina]
MGSAAVDLGSIAEAARADIRSKLSAFKGSAAVTNSVMEWNAGGRGAESTCSSSDEYDDEPEMDEEDIEDYCKGGYHPVKIGDQFKSARYRVVRKLGWGHFSTVWLSYDSEKDIHVALKIVKAAAHYAEAALDEIELCTRTVSIREPHVGRDHVAKMLDSFEHSGPTAATCSKQSDGLPLALVKQIARQIIAGLAYLHGPCNMIHTDLKPENVLVCIDNVEEVIRRELHNDSSAAKDGAQGRAPLRCQSRAPSPDGGNQQSYSPLTAGSSIARSLEKDLNGISLAATPTRSRHDFGEGSRSHSRSRSRSKDNAAAAATDAANDRSDSQASTRSQQQGLSVKLATWATQQDIQTRQYRSPEVIIGARWDTTADMWSCACVIFELLTGDYLFEPHSGSRYSKDEDHIAQIIETIGTLPRKFALSGKYSEELFTRRGELRNIRRLHPFPLKDLLHDEYAFSARDAREIADFLMPMLEITPARRSSAASMLPHRWLQ